MSGSIHPAIRRLNDTLIGQAYTAGTCEAGPHDLELYYRKAGETAASFIDFANVTPEQLEDLTQTCLPATFGRGSQGVLDETYRKAGKLDSDCFSTRLDLATHNILDSVTVELMDDEKIKEHKLTAELYKLNVYDKGAFFKAHKDTPRGTNMIGSLVLVLPTEHEGGSLVLRHNNQEWTFDSGKRLSESSTKSLITYVAFYSDVEHEVLPVTSGHRVTLTYNLYSVPRTEASHRSPSEASLDFPLEAALQELLADSSFFPSGGRIAWAFSHQYPLVDPKSLEWDEERDDILYDALQDIAHVLKGSDARLYRVCQKLGLETKLAVAYDLTTCWVPEDPQAASKDPYYYAHEYEATVLFDRIFDFNGSFIDDDMGDFLKDQGGEIIRKKPVNGQEPTFIWATQPNTLNRVEGAYTSYGNEPTLEYIYGDICLIVTIDDVETRK